MALRAHELDQLHASWDGGGLALWALDGNDVASPLALRSLISVAFGYDGLALVGSAVTPLYLPPPGTAAGDGEGMRGRRATYARSMRPFEQNAYALLRHRRAVDETSTSLRWVFAAADLAVLAARAGLLAPAIRHSRRPEGAGVTTEPEPGWEARWLLRHSVELDRAIASLGDQAPAAMWASFAGGAPEGGARAVVEYFADSAARWALEAGGWNPDLGRSTRADVVVARRITAALRGDRAVPTINGEQRAAASAARLALDEHRGAIDAGLGFRCRARLRLPDDTSSASSADPGSANTTDSTHDDTGSSDPDTDTGVIEAGDTETGDTSDGRASAPWRVTFEVVLVDDPTVTFSWSDLAAGFVEPLTTPGGVEVTETSLLVISRHVESLAADLAAQIREFADLNPERRHGAAGPRRRHQAADRRRRALCSTGVRTARSEGVGPAKGPPGGHGTGPADRRPVRPAWARRWWMWTGASLSATSA